MTSETMRYLVTADYRQLDALAAKNDEVAASMGRTPAQAAKQRASLDRVANGAGLLALGIGAIGVSSFHAAADYSKSMNVFQAVSGATEDQMKKASKVAVALGNDLTLPGVSAKDAGEALGELAKGGFTAEGSMKAVKGVLQLGQAAGYDYAKSATFVTRELKAFGLQAKDTGKLVDAISAASLKSTVGMDEIAQGMTYAQGSARTLGVSFQDTATSLSILNDNGVVGARAGTSLSMMFKKLAAPTEKGAAMMKKLGINVFDSKGQFIGMHGAVEQLQKGLGPLNQQQRLQALQTMFAGTAMESANIFARTGAKGYDVYSKAVNKAGATNKLLKAQTKGASGAIDQMKSAIDTFQITLGTELAPIMTRMLKSLTKFLGIIGKYPQVMAPVLIVIFGLASALWAVNKAMKAAETIKDIAKLTMNLAKSQKIAAAAAKIQAAAQWLLNAAMSANPIVLVVIALVALGVAFVIAYKKSETFRRIVQAALGAVTEAAGEVVNAAKWLLDKLSEVFNWIADNWPLIVGMLTGPFGLVAIAITTDAFGIRSKLIGVLSAIVDDVLQIGKNIAQALVDGIEATLGGLSSIGGTIRAKIEAAVTGAANWLKDTGHDIMNGLVGGIQDVYEGLVYYVGLIRGKVEGAVAGAYSWLVDTGHNIMNGLAQGIRDVYDGLVGVVSNIRQKVEGAVVAAGKAASWLYDTGKNIIYGLIGGIKSMAGKIVSAIKKYVIDKIPGPIRKVLHLGSPSRVMHGLGIDIAQGLINGIVAQGDAVERAARSLGDRAIQAASGQAQLRLGLAGAGAGGGSGPSGVIRNTPLVNIENVYAKDDEDARRVAAKLSATLAVRAT